MAFAYKFGGLEFHLTPTVQEETSLVRNQVGNEKLASPARQGRSSLMVMVSSAQSFGLGPANDAEIHNQTADHPVSNPNDNAAQKTAAAQYDDERLAEVNAQADQALRDEIEQEIQEEAAARNRTALVIMDAIRSAKDMNEFMDLGLAPFRAFYESGELEKMDYDDQETLWESVLIILKGFLQPKECPSPQAAAIQEMVRRLMSPKSKFDDELSSRFIRKFGGEGTKLLNTLNATQSCNVRLIIVSKVVMEMYSARTTLYFDVYAEFPLRWNYDGEPFLSGGGEIKYLHFNSTGVCNVTQAKLAGSKFTVVKLSPSFEANGELKSWKLWPYQVAGNQNSGSMECK